MIYLAITTKLFFFKEVQSFDTELERSLYCQEYTCEIITYK